MTTSNNENSNENNNENSNENSNETQELSLKDALNLFEGGSWDVEQRTFNPDQPA